MSGAEKPVNQRAARPTEQPLLRRTRTAQKVSGNDNSLTVNLTAEGVDIHGISAKDELQIEVYAEGIWISTTNE